ncbi:MAG: hypothetical protein OQK82_02600 [Candidatus Pacearchaeota archaeon]|nr:hypothetical protein [Candidatus Pacearchaeota archaeon]
MAKFSLLSFTGTDLWGISVGTISYDGLPDSTICDFEVIDSDNIGILISTAAQPSAMTVYSVLKTTGAGAVGYGNGTSSDYMNAKETRLVSDGLRMYWMVHTGTSTRQSVLNSALISNPTTSPFSRINIGGTYAAGELSSCKTGLTICRGILVVGDQMGDIFTYTPGESSADELLAIDNNSSGTYDTPVIMKSDGLNLWFFGIKLSSSGYTYGLYPIPSGLITRSIANTTPTDMLRHAVFIDENTYHDGLKAGNMLFDGRDMWLVTESGDLFRICAPGMR